MACSNFITIIKSMSLKPSLGVADYSKADGHAGLLESTNSEASFLYPLLVLQVMHGVAPTVGLTISAPLPVKT